jgi:hypothetical protein
MNRYSQLSFSDFSEIPLPQLPFEQLDAVLGQFQQQKDITDTLADQGFDHLNKEPDQLYAKKVRGEIDQLRQSLVESAQAGDTSNYMADLKEAQQKLLKMRAPGGGIKALADRKAQFNEISKATADVLRESGADQEYINEVLSEIEVGDVENPYGGYNPIGDPNIGEYYDLGKIVSDQLKNFKAEERGWVEMNGQWVDKYTKKLVDPKEVQAAAEEILSQPRYLQQLGREARILSRKTGMAPEESISRLANSYVSPTVRREGFLATDQDRKANRFVADRAQIDYEYRKGSGSYMTAMFTNNTGMEDFNYKVNNKGNIVRPSESRGIEGAMIGPNITNRNPNAITSIPFKQQFRGDLPKIKEENPALYDVYEKFQDQFNNLSDKEAASLLEQKYNEKKEALSKEWFQVETPGVKEWKPMQEYIVGKSGNIGAASQKTITVTAPGRAPETMSLTQFLKKNKIKPEEWTQNARYQGELNSLNSLQPTGHMITFTTPDGEQQYDIIASETTLEEQRLKSPIHALYKPAVFGDVDRSETVRLNFGNPELDSKEFYTQAQDVYTSDILSQEFNNLTSQMRQLSDDDPRLQSVAAKREEIREQLNRVRNNPSLDTYQERKLNLYTTDNPYQPLDITVEQLNATGDELIKRNKDQ